MIQQNKQDSAACTTISAGNVVHQNLSATAHHSESTDPQQCIFERVLEFEFDVLRHRTLSPRSHHRLLLFELTHTGLSIGLLLG